MTYRKSFQPRDQWRTMTPMPLGLFVKKLQPKVGLGRYDILFAYFVVEAKSKMVFEFGNTWLHQTVIECMSN